MIVQIYALYKREVLKMLRSKYMWATLLAQPLLWVVFFGNSLAGLPRDFLARFFGVEQYVAYMLPGMISITMMSMGMFSSMSLVFDKRLGYLKRVLATPTPKSTLFLAKSLSAATRGLLVVPIILAAGAVLGVSYHVNPAGLLAWIISLVLVGLGFSALFTALTANTSDFHAPGAVMNFITMPLMFTSTALFPQQFFPDWLKAISLVNPLTYLTEIGRDALIYSAAPPPSHLLAISLFAAAAIGLGIVVVEAKLTPD